MNNKINLAIEAVVVLSVLGLMFPVPAHAYIDLGVGSFMLQVLFGMGLAVWVSIKGFCLKIPFIDRFFKPKATLPSTSETVSSPASESSESGEVTSS